MILGDVVYHATNRRLLSCSKEFSSSLRFFRSLVRLVHRDLDGLLLQEFTGFGSLETKSSRLGFVNRLKYFTGEAHPLQAICLANDGQVCHQVSELILVLVFMADFRGKSRVAMDFENPFHRFQRVVDCELENGG